MPDPADPRMWIVGAIVLVWVAILVLMLSRFLRRRPERRFRPAQVVSERTEVVTGREDVDSVTTHYVTLEFADGERRELGAAGRVAGLLAEGDEGTAHFEGEELVDFERSMPE